MLKRFLARIKKLYPTKERLLASLFISALLVRLVFFLMVSPWQPDVVRNVVLQDDQEHLHRLSINLYETGSLSDDSRLRPNPYRTPGYPAFAGAVYYISGNNPWVVLFLQVLLDSLTTVLIAQIMLLFVTPAAAFWVTLLYVFDPAPVLYTSKLLSDPLYVFICTAALHRLAHFFKSNPVQIRLLIQSALLWGLSCYVRPLSQYIPLIIIIVLIIRFRKDYKSWIKYAAVFTILFTAVLTPWILRNNAAFGNAGFSTIGNHGLLFLHVKPMLMKKFQLSRVAADSMLHAQTDSLMRASGVPKNQAFGFKKGEYHTKLALYYIKSYPADFVLYYLNGCVRMYISLGTSAPFEMLGIQEKSKVDSELRATGIFNDIKYFISEKGLPQFALGFWIGILYLCSYILVLSGIYFLVKKETSYIILFALLFVVYITAVTGAAGAVRFKLPAIPFYLQIAAFGAGNLVHSFRQRKALP